MAAGQRSKGPYKGHEARTPALRRHADRGIRGSHVIWRRSTGFLKLVEPGCDERMTHGG